MFWFLPNIIDFGISFMMVYCNGLLHDGLLQWFTAMVYCNGLLQWFGQK
jgi:hypothetical protein